MEAKLACGRVEAGVGVALCGPGVTDLADDIALGVLVA